MNRHHDENELAPVEVIEPEATASKPLADRPLLVIALLFGATAALGLPVLWRSRVFTRWGKFWLSVAVILYTILIFLLFFMAMSWSLPRISEALSNF